MCVLHAACEGTPPPAVRAGEPAQAHIAARAQPAALRHAGAEWRTFALDLHDVALTLVGQKPGDPYAFTSLEAWLADRQLVMVTNAGIFGLDRRPLGLHIQEGELLSALSTADGEGNFFLKPNGVFWVDERGAHVASAADYAPQGKVQLATQSGPLLVSKGSIHPAFREGSTSLRTRSGVGVDPRGRVVFALSLAPVSFFATATLFRDVLHCPDALYLDGEISGLLAEGLPPPPPHAYGGLLVATRPPRK